MLNVYNKYVDLCVGGGSRPVRFCDAFAEVGHPSESSIDVRDSDVLIAYSGVVKIKKVTTIGKGKVTLVFGVGAVVENVLVTNNGPDLFIFFGPNSDVRNVVIQSFDSGGFIVFGVGTTADGLNILTQGENCGVFIGHDCMFSTQVHIRTSDSHSIFDYENGNKVNCDSSVYVGDHVWIGRQVTLGKGTRISDDVVIGMGSFVSGCIPTEVVAVGAPAKPVSFGRTWDRARVDRIVDLAKTLAWRPRQRALLQFLRDDVSFSNVDSDLYSESRAKGLIGKPMKWLAAF